MSHARFTLLLIILFCADHQICVAQERVSLRGQVLEAPSGLPVSAANVNISNSLNFTVTDQNGYFQFVGLSEGVYKIVVSHIGYQTAQVKNVQTFLNETANLLIRLTPQSIELPELKVSYDPLLTAGSLSGGRVITRETLNTIPSQDLTDLLEREGYVSTFSDGSPGGKKTVSLRGSSTDQVLVLLDGRPLNEAADGSADLSQISLSEVRQVEIYSQAPARLGVQAIGGVINIVTLAPGGGQNRAELAVSGYGERRGSLLLGRTWGKLPVLALFEHRESDGAYRYRIVPDDGLEDYTRDASSTQTRTQAGYRRDFITLKVRTPYAVEAAFRTSILQRQNPDYLPLPELEHESNTRDYRQELTLDIPSRPLWYRPQSRIKIEGYQQRLETIYGPEYPLLNRQSSLRGEGYQGELSWSSQQNPVWRPILGVGARWERLWSSDLNGGYADRLHEFSFFQAQGQPLQTAALPFRMGLLSGVRADFYQNQPPFLHPQIGLEISGGETPAWSVRGSFSGAYHLPSFNALFWQEDLQSRGNPDLKPERSLNQEYSGRLGGKRWALNVTYFHRRVWDLIYWHLDFDHKWKPLNLYGARIYGCEAEVRKQLLLSFVDLEAAVQHRWMQAINESGEPNTDDNFLPYRPENTTTLSLQQDYRYFTATVSSRWVSERFTNEANTKSLSPYNVWDAGITKEVSLAHARLTFRAEVRNLFNVGYRQVDRAPLPLRDWWFTISLERGNNNL